MNELGNLLRELRGGRSLREIGASTGISHAYISTIEKGIDPRKKTQKEVSEGTGIKESTLRMWELGKNNPSPHVLRTLSEYYKVDYIDIMKVAGYINDDDLKRYEKRGDAE